jgi:hypothetical protein
MLRGLQDWFGVKLAAVPAHPIDSLERELYLTDLSGSHAVGVVNGYANQASSSIVLGQMSDGERSAASSTAASRRALPVRSCSQIANIAPR